jgi:hypothetical protein
MAAFVGFGVLALLPLAVHCSRPLLYGDRFAFRDVGHYYYPLYHTTSERWRSGEIPLWNPAENLGQPLAADSTAAVFYPGQAMFLLPLPFDRAFTLFIVAHLVLAAMLMLWGARQLGFSSAAASFASLTYASGGYVLFQYCNLAYLIGAAWLPLGFLAGHQAIQRGGRKWVLLLAVSLAMMVLGGDAQTAYHVALITAGFSVYCWWHTKGALPGRRQVGLWGAGLLLAALLAAVQIGPSIEWARQATRTHHAQPLSLWHLLLHRGDDREGLEDQHRNAGLLSPPVAGSHAADIYDFSVGPWRLCELLWPSISGRHFPTHHRWTRPVFQEARIWTPSLYTGLLPILMAIFALRRRSAFVPERWWGWLVLFSLLASFGKYGLVWGLEAVSSWTPWPVEWPEVGGHVGGLYWLLVVVLPGYSSFRYPAKWIAIASVALSYLAAAGMDRLLRELPGVRPSVTRRGIVITFLISLGGIILLLAVRTNWLQSYLPVSDPVFGPLQPTGVFRDIGRSFLHQMVISLLVLGGLALVPFRKAHWLLATGLLLVTAVDLFVAHHWQIVTVPAPAPGAGRTHQELVAHARNEATETGRVRMYRGSARHWRPRSWAVTSSTRRLEELYSWNHNSLNSKFAWRETSPELSLIESLGSMQAADVASIRRVARQSGPRRNDGVRELPADLLRMLGTEWLLLPRDAGLDAYWREAGFVQVSFVDPVENVALWRNEEIQPRHWMVRQWEVLPPRDRGSLGKQDAWTRQHLFPRGSLRDLRSQAVLELENNDPIRSQLERLSLPRQVPDMDDHIRVIVDHPERLELELQIPRPGLLVISDFNYPGWECELIDHQGKRTRTEILRANGIMRGVLLEQAGWVRVHFRYRPWLLHGCLLLSACTWGGLIVGLASYYCVVRSRRGSHSGDAESFPPRTDQI